MPGSHGIPTITEPPVFVTRRNSSDVDFGSATWARTHADTVRSNVSSRNGSLLASPATKTVAPEVINS